MKLRTKGRPVNIDKHIVGKVSRDLKTIDSKTILLWEQEINIDLTKISFSCLLTTKADIEVNSKAQVVYKIPSLSHLEDGDIVSVGNDGNINTLYRINSKHNALLATERCNSNCLMCSQPPKDRNDVDILHDIHSQLIPIIPKDCIELGVTGGEPTLLGEKFFSLMNQLKDELPDTEIHVLSNGRSFAWNHLAERLAKINNNRLMIGIPIYSDFYQTHDYIVQAKNAFYQTILGIHNLARYNQRIEIRVVLHKQSIPRLFKLAKYIYKNMPFVEHVTFMGLEYIGYTPKNIDKLWIDPFEYQDILCESVEYLASKGMNVSIYNSTLCLLPERVWQYARKSISDWKNDYLTECSSCLKIDDCGGLFTWNLNKHSTHIKPFLKSVS
jgi:His-Xaa-Ser system radical SAM maturase HxsC